MGMLTPLSVTVSAVPLMETLSSLAFSASGRPVILDCAIAATDSSLVSLMVNSSLTVSIALTCAPAGSAFNFSSSGVVKSLVERPLPASVLTLPASASARPVTLSCATATMESSFSSLIASSPEATDTMLLTCAPVSIPASLVPSASVIRREPSTLSTLPLRPVVTSFLVA